MLRKVITVTVEYADYGGEENFITQEDVLAETFTECNAKLARHLEGRQYKVRSYVWKKVVIDDAAEHSVEPTHSNVGDFVPFVEVKKDGDLPA